MNEATLNDAAPEGEVLHMRVGAGSLADAAAQFTRAAKAAQDGTPFAPHFEVSFERMGQMLAVFTPKRWELVAALRAGGPSSVRALARRLGRNYKNVHGGRGRAGTVHGSAAAGGWPGVRALARNRA